MRRLQKIRLCLHLPGVCKVVGEIVAEKVIYNTQKCNMVHERETLGCWRGTVEGHLAGGRASCEDGDG